MKIIYMGTPDFAVPALKSLASSEHEVCAVFTQPDKPRGRKMVLTPPDVKVCAQSLDIPVYQPESMKNGDALEIIGRYNPDVIVVAAYGKILPKAVLDAPKFGCVNIHGSLLPKYRGAAPIQQSVLNGDKVTGITTMLMDVGLDTGDILLTEETEIGENETSGELFDRLAELGGKLILKTLSALEKGEITPKKQDESLATHTSKIDKSLCPIDFSKSAFEVHNKVRGLNPWPVATTKICGKNVKVYSTRLCPKSGTNGEVISTKPLVVGCGDKSVEILELQPEGKKRMTADAFLAGHKLEIGDIIGQED
ncbi:methionyl-tRNA formyltransferase [Ruminococcus sp.]|uniref:methionyl-tRNA formyltransferase n=1 Tax=Ruminococcus sp. TaxID=41978 RepID=UPI0025D18B5A|nr:methionyl-tRNA formyltransferase [Ruminococcus sp.]MCI6616787.1 methionyl-tRNA formyltransferase [Ruminococcus sp.]